MELLNSQMFGNLSAYSLVFTITTAATRWVDTKGSSVSAGSGCPVGSLAPGGVIFRARRFYGCSRRSVWPEGHCAFWNFA